MSYAGWGSNSPAAGRPTSSISLGGSVGYGGWGVGGMMGGGGGMLGAGGGMVGGGGGGMMGGGSLQQHQQDEAKFNSLFPIGGFLTGDQVKPVFEASGLPAAKLAQIWGSVDKDHDGKINKTEFCSAMAMIRQAQQSNQPSLLNSSLPASTLSGLSGPSLLSGSGPNSWSRGSSATPSSGGSGSGQGWALPPQDRRKYMMEFNTMDVSKSGFLSGQEARTVLTKSGLDKMVLAKIWELSDMDKDGKLSCDEYAVAMHLVAKVRGGASLPSNLPPELYGPAKFYTVDRVATKAAKPSLERKTSIPEQMGHSPSTGHKAGLGHTRNPSGGQSPHLGHTRTSSGGGGDLVTFEDRRKENFEAGKMELERRRRAIKEQQEREAAEKERKKREEEERRLQQEREAEQQRQAELERQRRKALEIEEERKRQMERLAKQREEEERELERRRKAEWTRKKCLELEGQRDWEKKSLHSLRVQHSQLEDQLRQLDQKKLSVQASAERHKSMFSNIILDLKSMRVSHDVRRAELSRMQSELNDYHTQLSSLQRQRRELREALQARSPETSQYLQQRQQLKDRIIGLAASLAGLRSNISHNTRTTQELTDTFKSNSQLLVDLNQTFKSDESAISKLRQKVLTQHAEAEQREAELRREREEREREERRELEERERLRREVEERAKKEARLERIKRDQEMALKRVKEEENKAKAKATSTSPPSSALKPPVAAKPTHLGKTTPSPPVSPTSPSPGGSEVTGVTKGWSADDQALEKKVLELKKKKAELQKQKSKDLKPGPSKPAPYSDKKQPATDKGKGSKPEPSGKGKLVKQDTVDKGKGKGKKGKTEREEPERVQPQLLNLDSSWDSTAEVSAGISSFVKDTNQILQPQTLTTVVEEDGTSSLDRQPAARQTARQTDRHPRPVAPPVPKPRSRSVSLSPEPSPPPDEPARYSVARLSKLFNEGASAVGGSGWSQDIQKTSSPTPQQSQDADYANLEEVTAGVSVPSPLPTPSPANPTSPSNVSSPAPPPVATPSSEVKYEVKYGYQAVDNTEVTLVEGEVVTFVPREDASAGWVMVRVRDGTEGWAPQSYLQPLGEGGDEERGVAKETGQAEPASPALSLSPEALYAEVKFSWQGSKDNHLSLVRGENVRVLQQSDKWWSGESHGKVGWFPKTFVKLLDAPPTSSEAKEDTPASQATPTTSQAAPQATLAVQATPPATQGVMYEAIYDYVGETEGDLSFQAGDVIEVSNSEGEWWTGTLNGVTGSFPYNYVELKEAGPSAATPTPISPITFNVPPTSTPSSVPAPSSAPSSTPSSTPSSGGKPLIARVMVAYQTTKKGQLELSPGQLVKVLKQGDSGWWEGELQNRGKRKAVGWFPANRVELLPQRKNSSSSSTSMSSLASAVSISSSVPARSVSSPAHPSPAHRVARAKSPLLEVLEDPNLVLALYTYTAQSADELSFHKGSVITVLGKEGEWWKGEVNDKVGLFPSNYVQPLSEQPASATEPTRWADSVSPDVLASVTDIERKRQEAIFELLTSERHYVDSLKLVKEVFFDPMAQGEVLTEEEMAKVMVNWDELIRCSNDLLSSFLVRLRTSGEVVRGIGDVLTSQIPHLTPHIRWCGCQLNACLLLQQKASDPKFKEFEVACSKDPRTGGLPLSSFLLKPMQRVTKYPLLVKKILDYTPSSDSDYEDLKSALTEARTLCDHVNDGVKQKENTEQLEWLQAHVAFNNLEEKLVFNSQTNFMGSRKLLHWGRFFKIRGSKDLVGFLFNDFLLLVRPKLFFPKAATPADLEPWGKNEFQMYRKPYLLDTLKGKKGGPDAGGFLLSLTQNSPEEKDILLRVDTEKARDEWLKKLTKASLEYLTTKKKMEREKQEQYLRTMRDSVGKLEVTVVEGRDLLAKDPNGKSDPFCVIRFGDQQEQTTPVVPQNNLNPKWNYTMTFFVHDINRDTLDITVFDKDLFSPNDFLGCGRVSLKDLLRDKDSPWEKTVLLENVANGEISLRIALSLNKSNLLL